MAKSKRPGKGKGKGSGDKPQGFYLIRRLAGKGLPRSDEMREKSTQGITLERLREQVAEAKARAAAIIEQQARQSLDAVEEQFQPIEEGLTSLEQDHDFAEQPTTKAWLEEVGAKGNIVELVQQLHQRLVDVGAITNPGAGPALVEPARDRNGHEILEPWMLRENASQDMTRWFVLPVSGDKTIFRFYKKHLPGQKEGERYTYLIRNLQGKAWRLAAVGPGRPPHSISGGTVTLNGTRYEWRETPTAKTMLGQLVSDEKDVRYAVVRDTSLDMTPKDMVPKQHRKLR